MSSWRGKFDGNKRKLVVYPIICKGFIQTSPVSGDAYFLLVGRGFLTNPSEIYMLVKLENFYPNFWGESDKYLKPPPSETLRA